MPKPDIRSLPVSAWIALAGSVVGITVLSVVLRQAMTAGSDTTLSTFSLVHFGGYLFFIISPVEILFVHMLSEEVDVVTLVLLAVGTALAAQSIDYGIGLALSDTVIRKVIGERKYRRQRRRIDTYGGATIFLFCLLPLSSPILVLVAGLVRYPFGRLLAISFSGLASKYLLLAWMTG